MFFKKLKRRRLAGLKAEWNFLQDILNRVDRISLYEEEKMAKLARKIARLEFEE